MPPRKTDTDSKPGEDKAKDAAPQDRAEVTETEAGPVRDDEMTSEEKTDTLKNLSTETPFEERAAALEDMPRVDPTRLTSARAVFDTSGTAGPADHDVRRASAAWDRDLLATEEEIPEHLKKYVDSPEGLPHMIQNAYSDDEKNEQARKDRESK
jgi:hypothetical protein